MTSDPKRVEQALKHIRRIKADDYPVVLGNSVEGGGYRIEERPWQDVPEPSKLAILQDAVDWSGISNQDQATILLSEIDPGNITAAQRSRLIAAAVGQTHEQHDSLRNELFREARPQPLPDHAHERQRRR